MFGNMVIVHPNETVKPGSKQIIVQVDCICEQNCHLNV